MAKIRTHKNRDKLSKGSKKLADKETDKQRKDTLIIIKTKSYIGKKNMLKKAISKLKTVN